MRSKRNDLLSKAQHDEEPVDNYEGVGDVLSQLSAYSKSGGLALDILEPVMCFGGNPQHCSNPTRW